MACNRSRSRQLTSELPPLVRDARRRRRRAGRALAGQATQAQPRSTASALRLDRVLSDLRQAGSPRAMLHPAPAATTRDDVIQTKIRPSTGRARWIEAAEHPPPVTAVDAGQYRYQTGRPRSHRIPRKITQIYEAARAP
jgi:hypothetical protein